MQEQLEKWLASKNTWKSNVKSFTKGWFNEGLRPRAITRDIEWGIPVPLEEAKGKVLYVWFDAPIGYISSTIEWAEKQGKPDLWKDYWYDKDTKLVHFIGKDNIVFHAIVWPAMLMAYNDGIILPSEIPANEFLNIETKKSARVEIGRFGFMISSMYFHLISSAIILRQMRRKTAIWILHGRTFRLR